MELDGKGLGRLRHVANARGVWLSESGDFTPWLFENLDVLADELGMTLTPIAMEVPVGEFRLDIQAQTPDGRIVIVENQLERTDHGHLGQLLVYASGLEASAVVWVAPRFRDDHRRTLDWLNERTDTGVDFFGVEVSVVQIGDSGPRAPMSRSSRDRTPGTRAPRRQAAQALSLARSTRSARTSSRRYSLRWCQRGRRSACRHGATPAT